MATISKKIATAKPQAPRPAPAPTPAPAAPASPPPAPAARQRDVAPPVIEQGSYGPTITLDPTSKWPFRFGIKKAELVLAFLEEIQAFVAEYGAK